MALALRRPSRVLGLPQPRLGSPAVLLSLPILLPPAYLLVLALQAEPAALWTTLVRMDLPSLLANMAVLSVGGTALALLVAVPWAWLVVRTDLPGRRLFQALGPLPLAIPPYVGALGYVALLAPGGLLQGWLAGLLGVLPGQAPVPAFIYSPLGAAFVLGVFSAPYVFITVQSALQRANPSLEEGARNLGLSQSEVFWRVSLPLLRPALLAGAFLVFLYSWIDFGVVSLLRVRTFTTVIYTQLLAGFSLPEAAGSALTLLGLVVILLWGQRRVLGGAQYAQVGVRSRGNEPRLVKLGRWTAPALAYLLLVVGLTLVLPLGVLAAQVARLEQAALLTFLGRQLPFLGNTLLVSGCGATLATGLALAAAWTHWRQGDPWPGALLQLGYAIPGTVLGLSLVGLTLGLFPFLYGTPLLLALAYLVLFAGPAQQAARAALSQISPAMEEAARALGRSPFGAARDVVVPLAWPGLAGAWLMAFILAARELAATLVLRPPGYDTLAVRIWVHTMDVGVDPRAAVVALLLVGLVSLSWLLVLALRRRASLPLA